MQDSAETGQNLVAKVCCNLVHSLYSLISLLSIAGVVDSSGPLETAATQCLCDVDGRQHHLPVPYHDGGDDAHQTVPVHLQLQRRSVSFPPLSPLFNEAKSLSPVFQKLRGDQALFQKAVYLLGNVMAVGLGLYKVNSMGLLPTAQSDWLEFMEDRQVGTEICSLSVTLHFFALTIDSIWRFLMEGCPCLEEHTHHLYNYSYIPLSVITSFSLYLKSSSLFRANNKKIARGEWVTSHCRNGLGSV